MSVNTLEALFVQELSDMYSAEKQLTKAIPKLARAATNPELVAAFESHLQETHHQVERLDQVVDTIGLKLKRIKCAAMEGLVEEGNEIIEEVEKGPVLDAALIAAAQKVEHYEIASYGTLLALARRSSMNQTELREAKRLMRSIIQYHLNGRPLKSRELFIPFVTSAQA